jgi:hypothetical protein
VAVAKKNDDIDDFFDMISLLNVAGASCKRKDMMQEKRMMTLVGALTIRPLRVLTACFLLLLKFFNMWKKMALMIRRGVKRVVS